MGLKTQYKKQWSGLGSTRSINNRYPNEFSGGQRQRIGTARSVTLKPKFIVCDEPVSALDVSIQAQVINLLQDLQDESGIAYHFVTHDLSVVRQISHRVAVMYLGHIVEQASRDDLDAQPYHPYTHALLSAVPVPDPRLEAARERIVLQGDLPSSINLPSGCVFSARCWKATGKCRGEIPELLELVPGRAVACHYPITESLGNTKITGPDSGFVEQRDRVVQPPSEVLQSMQGGRATRPKGIDYAEGEEPL